MHCLKLLKQVYSKNMNFNTALNDVKNSKKKKKKKKKELCCRRMTWKSQPEIVWKLLFFFHVLVGNSRTVWPKSSTISKELTRGKSIMTATYGGRVIVPLDIAQSCGIICTTYSCREFTTRWSKCMCDLSPWKKGNTHTEQNCLAMTITHLRMWQQDGCHGWFPL